MAKKYPVNYDGSDLVYRDETTEQTVSAGGGGLYGINVETLSADKTLTVGTDEMYQYLDEGGASRTITLDTASASAGDRWVIRHNGVYNEFRSLIIKQSINSLDAIYAGGIKEFIFDGTNWISGENGSGEDDDKENNVQVGSFSNANNYGTAIGYDTDAYNYGAAVGNHSVSYGYGVAVGYNSAGSTYGVALGYEADTNNNRYSTAIGYYSEAERYGEMARNIDGASDQENNITQGGFSIETTDATATEMLAGGYSAQRFTIRASSILSFKLQVVGRDNTSGDCYVVHFAGAIKRDGSNNTALVGNLTEDIIAEEDTSWDVAVTADDTNEALVVTVTGDATNTVQWAAVLNGVETHF